MNENILNFKSILKQLIGARSISCTNAALDQSNSEVIYYLAEILQTLGFKIDIQTVDKTNDKLNLIASIGKGDRGLVLAGHTDTVPCDEQLWTSNPFELSERDNRFYGLGIADMKSFFAFVIEAISDIDLKRLKQPLIILATSDEETSMAGAKAIASHGEQFGLQHARFAVIGEPTSFTPIRIHKGIMMQSIRLTGQSGHSSNPALGNNAMESMHKVMTELLRWRHELQERYHNPLFDVPVPTMNFGHIHGGDNPNRICGHCELQIDIRPLPGMPITELKHEMRSRLQALLKDEAITMDIVDLTGGVEAMDTSATSELVRFAEQQTSNESQAAAYCTEAPFYNAMGIETIVLGPGNIEQAHQPDEFLDLATIHPYTNTLNKLIRKFCM